MKIKRSGMFLGIIVLAMALSLSVSAPPAVQAITVADMLGGMDVLIGDKSFENFRDYVSVGTNGAWAVSPGDIFISFSITPEGLYEVDYQTGAMFVGPNQIQDTRFTYDVRVIPEADKLEDDGLELLSFGLGHNQEANLGRISISETVTDAAGVVLGTKLVYDDHGVIVNPDHISWSPAVDFLTVRKDIALWGDDREGGGAFISDFSQTYSQTGKVPEPMTILLYGLGFAGAGVYRRLRKRQK